MQKMDGKSMDLIRENIARLKELFPEAVTEGKVDFNVLKAILGGEIETRQEYYKFTWNGKETARAFANTCSMGTLRPCVEESSGRDGTPGRFDSENLYIEGDNLEALKLLMGGFYKKVKMIYIDPPYNTGHDFVYPDDFRNSLKNYKLLTGQTDGEGKATRANPETSGRYHTDWLNMMYPRLLLARNLLADDGVIFISIDDNEQDNLKKLCNEVFGEENYTATFLWTKTSTPPALSCKCRKTVEYVLTYEKNLSNLKYYGSPLDGGDAPLLNTENPIKTLLFPEKSIHFNFMLNGIITPGNKEKGELLDEIKVADGVNANAVRIRGAFKWEQATLDLEIKNGTYFIIKSEKFSIRFQRKNLEDSFKTPVNFINIELNKKNDVGTNESAAKELENFGLRNCFDYTKPVSLIKSLIKMICKNDKNAVVLDFFSGSATTAHAVMQLNAEDGGNRKFIMIQLPEPCAEGTEAAKAGYRNICEIGKERIRRAAKKIREENPLACQNQDMGFKVFKLDTSNLLSWNPKADTLKDDLFLAADGVLTGRTTEDLLYEILLKCNLPLSLPIEKRKAGTNTVYIAGKGVLAVCLDPEIPPTIAEEIIKLRDEYEPDLPMRVVFRDGGLSDIAKTNALKLLRQEGFEERAVQTI